MEQEDLPAPQKNYDQLGGKRFMIMIDATKFNRRQQNIIIRCQAKLFWFSVNWTFSRFEVNYLERRKVHAKDQKETSQLHTRREGNSTTINNY